MSLPEPSGSSFGRRWREVRALQLSGWIGPRFPYALAGGLGWLAFRGSLGLPGIAWWVPGGAALMLVSVARQSVSSGGTLDLTLALGARLAAGGLLVWLALRLASWASLRWPRGLRWFDTLARRPAVGYLLASVLVWLLGPG